MFKCKILLFLLFFLIFVSTACSFESKLSEGDKVVDIVATKKIFFGHQSVGRNILHGLSLVDYEKTIKIVDLKVSVGGYQESPGFYHEKVGDNRSPESKVDEFGKIIETYFNGDLDVAFLKLCYVDVTKDTNIDELFSYYRSALKILKAKFSDVTFVHITVPLMTNNSTWKTQLKKIMGKDDIWEYANNIKRNHYNQLIINEYNGKEPIFDIAALEATRFDDSNETFSFKGHDYYAMAKELSSDGGHLNDVGSKKIALSLLDFLANLSR